MSSKVKFDRWNPKQDYSLPYSSYVANSSELRRMYRTMVTSHKYVYKSLAQDRKATWSSSPNDYFDFPKNIKKTYAYFTDLKSWSASYNKLENWNNLNTLVAINANFETYMVKVIGLALESDVGVLYGMPKAMDGIKAIKAGKTFDFSNQVIACTKGDWYSRVFNIEKIFGKVPVSMVSNVSALDKIRKMRNDVAHAFGRNIDAAQEIHDLNVLRMCKLNENNLLKYWDLIDSCVSELDNQLFKKHIGEYQLLCLYHLNESEVVSKAKQPVNLSTKAAAFRKLYGQKEKNGINTLGQEFAKGLIEYYDNI